MCVWARLHRLWSSNCWVTTGTTPSVIAVTVANIAAVIATATIAATPSAVVAASIAAVVATATVATSLAIAATNIAAFVARTTAAATIYRMYWRLHLYFVWEQRSVEQCVQRWRAGFRVLVVCLRSRLHRLWSTKYSVTSSTTLSVIAVAAIATAPSTIAATSSAIATTKVAAVVATASVAATPFAIATTSPHTAYRVHRWLLFTWPWHVRRIEQCV
jgi:hypothetical protein